MASEALAVGLVLTGQSQLTPHLTPHFCRSSHNGLSVSQILKSVQITWESCYYADSS